MTFSLYYPYNYIPVFTACQGVNKLSVKNQSVNISSFVGYKPSLSRMLLFSFFPNNPLKILLTIHSLQALPDSAQDIDGWSLAYTIDPCLLFLSFGRAAVRWEEDTGTQKELPSIGKRGEDWEGGPGGAVGLWGQGGQEAARRAPRVSCHSDMRWPLTKAARRKNSSGKGNSERANWMWGSHETPCEWKAGTTWKKNKTGVISTHFFLLVYSVNHSIMQETWIYMEGPLEEETAACSSILAWKIPRTEESGGLQSMGSLRVGHDWACTHACTINSVPTEEIRRSTATRASSSYDQLQNRALPFTDTPRI